MDDDTVYSPNKYRETEGIKVNKSHAVCYGMIAYIGAFLKANYPVEYMCAVLEVFYDSEDKVIRYSKTAKDMGIDVLPPSINRSNVGFVIDGDNAIRFGLGCIKGLGEAALNVILEERNNGDFTSIEDVIDRVPKRNLNKAALTALIYSGAFDEFIGENFDNRFHLLAHALTHRGDKPDPELLQNMLTYTEKLKFEKEKEVLGLYVSGHVLDRYADSTDWENLDDSIHRTVVVINEVKVITTKKGQQMAFMKVDTLEGERTLTVFPSTFEKHPVGLIPGMIIHVGVKGQMNWQRNQKDFIAHDIKIQKKINSTLWQKIKEEQEKENANVLS